MDLMTGLYSMVICAWLEKLGAAFGRRQAGAQSRGSTIWRVYAQLSDVEAQLGRQKMARAHSRGSAVVWAHANFWQAPPLGLAGAQLGGDASCTAPHTHPTACIAQQCQPATPKHRSLAPKSSPIDRRGDCLLTLIGTPTAGRRQSP